MPDRSLEKLTRQVTEYFRKQARKYGLNADTVQARYILNLGGFVNASFQVTDGKTSYHLKLADDEEQIDRLINWESFQQELTERYHAPQMVAWVNIPRTPWEGILFEFIPGEAADLARQPLVLRGVLDTLDRLHQDTALAEGLAEYMDEGEPLPACWEYFLDVYIDRFDSDLQGIIKELPPFVSLELFDWMSGETRELEGLARDLPAFQQPANAPTHGDLWQNNILVTGDREFWIIDWDDFFLGDPALDYSILLGSLWRSGALSRAEIEALLPSDADFRARFDLYLRALVLDQVIDSLADWVESSFAPEHQAEVRAGKELDHSEALALYRSLYLG